MRYASKNHRSPEPVEGRFSVVNNGVNIEAPFDRLRATVNMIGENK